MNAHAPGVAARSGPAALSSLFCLLATGSLLGISTLLAGLAIRSGWEPLTFLFWSTLGGGLLLLVGSRLRGQRLQVSRALLPYAVIAGLLSFALPNLLSFSAIPHVGAGFIALCLAFPPLLTYAIAVPIGMDRLSLAGIAGMACGLGGALLLARSAPLAATDHQFWTALAMAAPLIIALGNIYRSLAWPRGASPGVLAPAMLLASAGLIAIASATVGSSLATPPLLGTAGLLLGAQAVVIAATYVLYFLLQQLSGPVGLSQIGWIAAGVGKALAVIILGEAIPGILLPACAAILAGIALLSRRPR